MLLDKLNGVVGTTLASLVPSLTNHANPEILSLEVRYPGIGKAGCKATHLHGQLNLEMYEILNLLKVN